MSIDLEWSKLDSVLASRLVELLNKHLLNINRPSFIGPVEVTSFEFGSAVPDVEVVDIRDIHRDFLEDDEEEEREEESAVPDKSSEYIPEDDSYEWVSRRSAGRGLAHEGPAYHHLPPHLRYGRSPSSDFVLASPPPGLQSPRSIWDATLSSPSLLSSEIPREYLRRPSTSMTSSIYHGSEYPLLSTPPSVLSRLQQRVPKQQKEQKVEEAKDVNEEAQKTPDPPTPPNNNHPDLQIHLRIFYDADIRISITTSLIINYPSPLFMSLPIKLSVIGLVFDGEVAVAYEGSRRRIHLCVLDDLDPYSLSSENQRKRDTPSATPPEMEGDVLESIVWNVVTIVSPSSLSCKRREDFKVANSRPREQMRAMEVSSSSRSSSVNLEGC